MTREQLESYKSKKEEIKELRYKLHHLNDNDKMVGNDVVMDYRSGYPVPQSVVGVDWQKYNRAKDRYNKRIQQLEEECEEIEQFVETIEESLIRRIVRMYYIDGMSQKAIAKATHFSQAKISTDISAFWGGSRKE